MIISCPACTTRYVVPDSAIGVEGRTVRCAKCHHSWFQDGPELELTAPDHQTAAQTAAQQAASAPAQTANAASAPPPAPATGAAAPHSDPGEAPPAPHQATPHQATQHQESAPAAQGTTHAEPADTTFPPPPFASAPVAQPPSAPAEVPDAPPAPTPPSFDPRAAAMAEASTQTSPVDEDVSRFEHEPPFRPRRNRLKLWTAAAILFALATTGIIAAVNYWGLPDWVPVNRPVFAEAKPELRLSFPPEKQDRRTLPNGTEFFGASGVVTNVGSTVQTVPPILIILRDGNERIVYSWEVPPPKTKLAPGESVTVNEAVTDVPRSAKFAEIGWKPN